MSQLSLWGEVVPAPLAPPTTLDATEPEPVGKVQPTALLGTVEQTERGRVVLEAEAVPAGPPVIGGRDLFGNPVQTARPAGALSARFVVPPFSVLNAREGAWQERKRQWLTVGLREEATADSPYGRTLRTEEGRDLCLIGGGNGNSAEQAARLAERYGVDEEKLAAGGQGIYSAASSAFDPVLCELMLRWFCPSGGHVLDPFAGESTKGIVAGVLGYPYTGCELRQEQVDANRRQAEAIGVTPTWVCGDSARLVDLIPPRPAGLYDFVWTSPPYYDLEVYSESEADGSAFASYTDFMDWYELVFAQCEARLKEDRFLAVKVGEIRDERGVYRNFVGDNIMNPNTQRPRRVELVRRGYVVDTGRRRPTDSGRQAVVWGLAARARLS